MHCPKYDEHVRKLKERDGQTRAGYANQVLESEQNTIKQVAEQEVLYLSSLMENSIGMQHVTRTGGNIKDFTGLTVEGKRTDNDFVGIDPNLAESKPTVRLNKSEKLAPFCRNSPTCCQNRFACLGDFMCDFEEEDDYRFEAAEVKTQGARKKKKTQAMKVEGANRLDGDNYICGMFDPDEDDLEQDELIHQIMGLTSQGTKEKAGTKTIKVRAMVDSGACVSACPPKFARKAAPLKAETPSEKYRAANNSSIMHCGSKAVKFVSDEGLNLGLTFQVADIANPLVAPAELAEKGHETRLLKTHGEIHHSSGKVLRLEKIGKAYYLNMLMEVGSEDEAEMAVFARRG